MHDTMRTKMLSPTADPTGGFGDRLARLRTAAGYTQLELAAALGITQRAVARCELYGEHPRAQLLPLMARILGVSTDALLGFTEPSQPQQRTSWALERRLLEVGALGPEAQQELMQLSQTR